MINKNEPPSPPAKTGTDTRAGNGEDFNKPLDAVASSNLNEAAQGTVPPPSRTEFLSLLGLPSSTSDAELTVILHANGGAQLPFKAAVFTSLLRLTITRDNLPEDQARKYLSKKFPGITGPGPEYRDPDAAATNLREKLITLYGLPETASESDIAAAAAESRSYELDQKARRLHEEAEEALIQQKISKGLTREQAINTIARQRKHDEALAKDRAERRSKILKILQGVNLNSLESLRAARKIVNDEYPFLNAAEFHAAVEELKNA